MNPKIKKIIIFSVVAVVLVLAVVILMKKKSSNEALVTSSSDTAGTVSAGATNSATADKTDEVGKDFVSTLLSVKSIKLDDSIFSDVAFTSLKDSSISLVSEGNEGRPNPFAPIGTESSGVSATTTDTTTSSGGTGDTGSVLAPEITSETSPAQTSENKSTTNGIKNSSSTSKVSVPGNKKTN